MYFSTLFLIALFPFSKAKLPYSLSANFTGIEFCDGETFLDSPQDQCPFGYNFEAKVPECLCVKGIYRIYLDNCDMADGFAIETTCTKPYDPSNGAKITSMQLIPQPNLELTHIVASAIKPNRIWEIRTLGKNDTMLKYTLQDDNFYVINGKAFIEDNGGKESIKQKICVQYATRDPEDKNSICRIFRADNDLWSYKQHIEITLQREPCPKNTFELQTHTCFPPLNDEHSECHLDCDKEAPQLSQVDGDAGGDCTDDAEVIRHDNEFLDRKMLQYTTLVNIRDDIPPLEPFQPNRTFELFKKMVEITKKKCSNHFVPHEWVDYAIQLFYLLHKGNEFRYEEFLTPDQFTWINSILDQCLNSVKEVDLITAPFPDKITEEDPMFDYRTCCLNDPETAWGYCPDDATSATEEYSSTTEPFITLRPMNPFSGKFGLGLVDWTELKKSCPRPIKIEPSNAKTGDKLTNKHYIPELAWSIVDMTQAACFREFNESYRMFHLVEQAAEKLFTTQIKHLWYNPPYNAPGSTTKDFLLGLGADELMKNLEICIGSVYDQLAYDFHVSLSTSVGTFGVDHIVRLKRPRKEMKLRRKRRSLKKKSLSDVHQIYCAKKKNDFKVPMSCVSKNSGLHESDNQLEPLPEETQSNGGGGGAPVPEAGSPTYDLA